MEMVRSAFFTYISGLNILIILFWVNNQVVSVLGWLLLFSGFLFFALDVKDILKNRLRRKLDKSLTFSIFAIRNGLVIHFLFLLVSILGEISSGLWSWLIFIYKIGRASCR